MMQYGPMYTQIAFPPAAFVLAIPLCAGKEPVRGGPFLRTFLFNLHKIQIGVGGLKNDGCANYMAKNNMYT